MATSHTQQTNHNLFGKILIAIMAIDILLIFIVLIFYSNRNVPEIPYRRVFFYELGTKYPLCQITYLLSFIGIIYLSIAKPTKNWIKYIVGGFTIIISSIMVLHLVETKADVINWAHDYYQCANTSGVDISKFKTGYNFMDFITGEG